jgi:hypothetical protein
VQFGLLVLGCRGLLLEHLLHLGLLPLLLGFLLRLLLAFLLNHWLDILELLLVFLLLLLEGWFVDSWFNGLDVYVPIWQVLVDELVSVDGCFDLVVPSFSDLV